MTSSISSAWSSAAWRTDVGVGAGSQASRELASDVKLDVRVAHEESLGIGVDGDELDAAEADFDHSVNCIHATAADADDLDDGQVILRCCHVSCPLLVSYSETDRVQLEFLDLNPLVEGYSYVK